MIIHNNNSGHTVILRSKFNSVVDDYWNLKLHKYPSKARFIIAAPQRFVKLLSKPATLV